MIDLESKNVTLLCVSDIRIEDSIKALLHCSQKIKYKKIKFLTSNNIESLDSKIELIKIDPIKSTREYSKFMIVDLNNYVDTDYVLICQYDGIVINPDKWNDEFLQYDYIGAPWPTKSVGNGGFSLRSKKLLETINDNLKIFENNFHPEDSVICHNGRSSEKLEKLGIKKAPYLLASKFSVEYGHYTDQFGAHNNIIVRRTMNRNCR